MSISGIDVSSYQGNVDYNRVKAAGYKFVIVKATEGSAKNLGGTGYLNPYFKSGIAAANAAGVVTSAYHYFRGVNEQDARNEAQWFIQNLKGVDVKSYLFVDVEDGKLTKDKKALTSYVNAFLDELTKAGYQNLGIYSGLYFYKDYIDANALKNVKLKWIADYGVSSIPISVDIWQKSSTARVSGVGGDTDENVAYNNEIIAPKVPLLKVVTSSAPAQTTTPVKTSVASTTPTASLPDTYTVKAGENLTVIAQRFGLTVATLVSLNGLSNPDLIKTGQVLKLKGTPAPQVATTTYTINPGDTLTDIAARFKSTVSVLVSLNGIKDPNVIKAGQVIKIPVAQAVAPVSTGYTSYTVKAGDTLSGLGEKYNLDYHRIMSYNGLASTEIFIGQTLKIPVSSAPATYTVKAGENLTEIAKTFNTSVNALASLNGIKNPNMIQAGQVIKLR